MELVRRVTLAACLFACRALAASSSTVDHTNNQNALSSTLSAPSSWDDCRREGGCDESSNNGSSLSSTSAPAACQISSTIDNTSAETTEPTYTAFDDASWAITSSNMTNRLNLRQKDFYESFIDECRSLISDCQDENEKRIFMNVHQPPSVKNYTQQGFQKMRAPPELMQLLTDFWKLNKDKAEIETEQAGPFHNTWKHPTNLILVEDTKFLGGGWNLSAAIWNSTKDILEAWTGQKLAGSSVYGIRIYNNNSVLAPHVDRLPLISSAIINVAQDVEEDWPLEVYGHDGKATNVTMKPGDMVLYESHSVIHGRPFPLNGKYFANIFVHFEPLGHNDSNGTALEEGGLPPYLQEGSAWEEYYWEDFPDGWDLLTDVGGLAQRGDLETLRYVAKRDPQILHGTDAMCDILGKAVKGNQLKVLDWAHDELQCDINIICESSITVLDYALYLYRPDHPIVSKVQSLGGKTAKDITGIATPLQDEVERERCKTFFLAIEKRELKVLEFLLDHASYEVNLICGNWFEGIEHTMLDAAYELNEIYGNYTHIIEFLIKSGAQTLDEMDGDE